MKIIILTIFPEIFDGFLKASIIGKSLSNQQIDIQLINFRDFAAAPHKQVDDTPYGGGAGMVLKPEPLIAAIERCKRNLPNAKTILLSASGKLFNQKTALNLSQESEIVLVCGRYEGIDERVVENYIDMEISIGNFVLMGGEVAAMALIESTVRLIPNILGNQMSTHEESFTLLHEGKPLLEAPQYTKPSEFNGFQVPEVLLSGDHKQIAAWRKEKALEKTKINRPDLINE